MVRGRTRKDLEDDRLLQLALTRLLSIVGEASSHVAAEGRARFAQVPWRELAMTRDRIVRGDFSTDCDITWQILNEELPPLIAVLERALPGHVR